jgi:hypothetical protein
MGLELLNNPTAEPLAMERHRAEIYRKCHLGSGNSYLSHFSACQAPVSVLAV